MQCVPRGHYKPRPALESRKPQNLWTLTETRHVLRNDPPGSGTTAKLGAARNEWVSFQILLRSEEPMEWGRAVREAKSVVKVLVVEQTWTEPGFGSADSAWGDLYGDVDIWCPLFSLHRPESAAKRQALGEAIWTYTALCQGPPTPWWHIDFPLLNYRVPAWMA